jgi:hypothetical protein
MKTFCIVNKGIQFTYFILFIKFMFHALAVSKVKDLSCMNSKDFISMIHWFHTDNNLNRTICKTIFPLKIFHELRGPGEGVETFPTNFIFISNIQF